MSLVIDGVVPLEGGAPCDILVEDGVIAAMRPAPSAPARRRLAIPALVNAHDHARPLSPTSFGAAGKPLETWLLRLAAMPGVDPYCGALASFGRAARGGAGSVMAHLTRFSGLMPPVEEARLIAQAAGEVGIRLTLAIFMRDRNPVVYGDERVVLARLPEAARAAIAGTFMAPRPDIAAQVALVEDIARAVEGPMVSVQFGPNGPGWCSDGLLARIADASRDTGRRVHTHLLETRAQRAFADKTYPEGLLARLDALGLLTERLTLAHCVHARADELAAIAQAGAIIATNASSNLHLRSGVAPIASALDVGCRVAIGIDASALDEDDDALRELRLGHFLHGGWGFGEAASRENWLSGTVANGRFANGAPGDGALRVGAPADILLLDLDRLDRDAIMRVAPVDYLFARATAAHIASMFVAGREIVRDGVVTGVDLPAVEAALREKYRSAMGGRTEFLGAWDALEPAVAGFYREHLGCC